MSPSRPALLRSHSGLGASAAFSVTPPPTLTRIEPPLFWVLLQRRLHLPLPLSNLICGCGRPLDSCGHHRAACGRTGVLGWEGFPLESARARLCWSATRNWTFLWLPMLADGWPLWGGVQLAVDTTLVSALRGGGNPRRGASTRDCVALTEARSAKERVYPELAALGALARLVVHWRLEAAGPRTPLTSCLNLQEQGSQ